MASAPEEELAFSISRVMSDELPSAALSSSATTSSSAALGEHSTRESNDGESSLRLSSLLEDGGTLDDTFDDAFDWLLDGKAVAGDQCTREEEAPFCSRASSALPATSSPSRRREARRRALAASSSSRHRRRKKLEADTLKEEATHLSAQLALLRTEQEQLQHSKTAARYAEAAKGERHRRRASERQNAALRDALYSQRTFLLNLKSLLASPLSPGLSVELNLHELLHTYCRLGASERLRAQAAEALFSNAKLDLALRVVLSETASMQCSVSAPMIVSSCVAPSVTTIGATQKSVFAFETIDLPRATLFALEGAHASGQEWPQHTLLDAESVGDSPTRNIRFEASTVRFRNIDSGNAVSVESRSVSCVRATAEYCLMVTDCVDADELYPRTALSTCLKQDMVAV